MNNQILQRYLNIINEATSMIEMMGSGSSGGLHSGSSGGYHSGSGYSGSGRSGSSGGYHSGTSGSSGGYPMREKWDKPTTVSPEERGKYAGKSKAELLKAYNQLKASGPHHKGSKEYGRMRELAFAIRAKGGWGKVA